MLAEEMAPFWQDKCHTETNTKGLQREPPTMSYNRVQQGCSQHPSCTGKERLDKAIQSPVFSSCGYRLVVNGLKQPVSYVVQKDPRLCTRKALSATPASTEVIQLRFGTAFKQTNKLYEDMRPSRYQLSMGSRPVTSTHLWDEHG